MRRVPYATTPMLMFAVALLAAACSESRDQPGDGPSSAEIRTVPSVVSPPTTTPAATAAGIDQPAATSTAPPTGVSTATSTTPPTAPPSTTIPPSTTVAPRVGNPAVTAVPIGTFESPVGLAARPGDDALYIVEQVGRVIRHTDESATVLDISGLVSTGGEQGLLGLAFSPDGTMAYVNFTDADGTTVVDEFVVDDDGVFDLSSRRTVITVDQPFSNHNGGDLTFGPDGLLYIALGDGGSGGDPNRDASDPRTLLGSLLRIDPTPTADAGYTIPPDNPFADSNGGAPEAWAWGLRNPWKVAFDPITADLWIADVGQNSIEEVNVVPFVPGLGAGWGVNFGWSAFEGNEPFNSDVPGEGATPPVLTYTHADGCSISGGVPYRGEAIADLAPAYVYSDFCTGDIWALDLVGGRNLTLLRGFDSVSAVRAGPDGELYVLERSGTVHRLAPG